MSNRADEIILKINKLISQRVAQYVGKTTVTDLMAISRRVASASIVQVFKAEGLDSVAIGKLPEGAVFQVEQDEKDPSAVRVLLQEAVRRSIERETMIKEHGLEPSEEKTDDAG